MDFDLHFWLSKLRTKLFRKRLSFAEPDIWFKADVIYKKKGIHYCFVKNDINKMSFDDQMLVRSMDVLNPLLNYMSRPIWWTVFVRFPEKPLMAKKVEGILSYLPVFGGCIYVQHCSDNSCIYGFATNASMVWDETERDAIEYYAFLKIEAENFTKAIQIASKGDYESAYLLADSSEDRINVVEDCLEEIRQANIPVRMPTYSAIIEMEQEVIRDLSYGQKS